MSDPSRQLEREEDAIQQALENGELTSEEYNKEMSVLYREYCDAAEEAAQNAYSEELERW